MQPSSIRPAKLADAIAEHIQQMILEGALYPGERLLPERELSARLDVSRPSLREALDKLVGSGLLTTDARGVAHVSQDIGKSLRDPLSMLMETPEARVDFLELRSVIEAAASTLAAERASEIDRDTLRSCYEAMVSAQQLEDADALARADAEFHLAIYEASHNQMLLHLMISLENMLRSNVYLNRRTLYEKAPRKEALLGEHKAILDAILARDGLAAREAASHHMTSAMHAQKEIYDAERRHEASIRRLSRSDLVASRSQRSKAS
ncbi:FCD domain-containing protein [Sphingopyxis sp.]|jgi:GntR family transcriptional repressor for pyruvate dehydrogenase complex|uniref:FCD domain-containing protein n=1 Tax=Sphingopyxis sp. TaxID=1908224 RepID=UPI002DE9ECC6|nr:FCD domain-containing protein [Sphingopyxis sp.]